MSKKVYIESYGCQMNHSDSEIVASILVKDGYETTSTPEGADLVLLNTCSIREKAEYTVLQRINEMKHYKQAKPDLKVGVLGCMAERMREDLLVKKKVVDLVVGPDAYRSLPSLLDEVEGGQKAVNVLLSREETYAEIEPVRLDSNGVTAFVTIMRGCDNMCAFCVVPFTRGRERSRDPQSIVHECRDLVAKGYKEVTLLGQNVDSYEWTPPRPSPVGREPEDFCSPTVPDARSEFGVRGSEKPFRGTGNPEPRTPNLEPRDTTAFADLLVMVAEVSPALRVRYSTSHPKDMTDKVLEVMARYPNICNYVHLPVQSGSSDVLQRMNRGYTRQWYLDRIAAIRRHMPDCAISTDIITGFCGETEEDHQQTLRLLDEVRFDMAFMFKYSERPKTLAARKYPDDVPEDIKGRRLQEVIAAVTRTSGEGNQRLVGTEQTVLIEGVSKRSSEHMFGRSDRYNTVIVPRVASCRLSVVGCPSERNDSAENWSRPHSQASAGSPTTDNQQPTTEIQAGDYVCVLVKSATASSLQGEVIAIKRYASNPA